MIFKSKLRHIWLNQKYRCEDPKSWGYKFYGAKGIKVEYSFEEFYEWFLKNKPKNYGKIKHDIGRIDHDKNYSLDNICIQTKTENISERIKRNGSPCRSHKQVIIYDAKTLQPLMIADSMTHAGYLTGINRIGVWKNLRKDKPFYSKNGYTYSFVGEKPKKREMYDPKKTRFV